MNTKSSQKTVERFRAARRDRSLVVVEGLHALKHARRFQAVIREAVAADPAVVQQLAAGIAPDLLPWLAENLQTVAAASFAQLAPAAPHTGVVAIAERPVADPAILGRPRQRPIVLLDDPRHYGNIGAVIRVAAAAGAAAVVVVGDHDPWHPEAVRGAAGLQFALPILQLEHYRGLPGPLVAVDPAGEPLSRAELPPAVVLAFGSERAGLSEVLRRQAAQTVRIPMAPGVSSLNLATSVAVMLYYPAVAILEDT